MSLRALLLPLLLLFASFSFSASPLVAQTGGTQKVQIDVGGTGSYSTASLDNYTGGAPSGTYNPPNGGTGYTWKKEANGRDVGIYDPSGSLIGTLENFRGAATAGRILEPSGQGGGNWKKP
jgi:hypothetical protein